MVRKLVALGSVAFLVALPLQALAVQEFKNHGQCVKACVHDLGVKKNDVCSKMCEAGTYGQPTIPPVVPPPPPIGTLPAGASCDAANDLCASPLTCQPFMPGWPMYYCK